MNLSYTPAQFTKGLREARQEERAAVLFYIAKRVAAETEDEEHDAAGALASLALDLKEGEHLR